MNREWRNLIFGIILGIIITSLVFLILYVSFIPKTQNLKYSCKISEQSLENVGCTYNSDCWSPGIVCDTLLYKCVSVPSGNVNGEQIISKISPPNNQQDCEKIGGNWKLELIS